jgi:hypothetical protein
MRGWLAFALVLALLLSGCASKNPSSSSSSTSQVTSRATATNTTTAAPAPNHAPTALVTATTGNGTAALNVTFALAGTDADGDALNWTLAFGDAAANRTGAALPANVTHSYNVTGLVNVTFSVTDGKNTTQARLALNLTAGGPSHLAAALTDGAGDSQNPFTDLLDATATYDAGTLVAVLHVDTIWPTNAALTPVSYSFAVNGIQFDSFGRYPQDSNPMTWDGGAYLAAGSSSWDPSANTITFTFDAKVLADHTLAPPFAIAFLGNDGGLLATNPEDHLPDSGTVTMA